MFVFEWDRFDWLSKFYNEGRQTSKLVNLKISPDFLVCDFLLYSKMTKTLKFCSVHQENTCKSHLHSNLFILSDFHSFTVNEDKLQNLSIWRSLLMSGYAILFKIWKWLKLRNSVRFIKKTLLNHVYNWIWSFWLSFTVLQWMKTSFKISKFSRSLLRSGYAILLKIWKSLKLLNSVPFIKKIRGNHVYSWIWSFWLTFTVLQWMKANFEISQLSWFLLTSGYAI